MRDFNIEEEKWDLGQISQKKGTILETKNQIKKLRN